MKLTDKTKIDFEQWYKDTKNPNGHWYSLFNFYGMVDSMKYGVYVDFFDSVGIWVMDNMFSIEKDIASEFIGQVETVGIIWNTVKTTRQEARIEAIKKANEIYNENN